MEPAQLAGKGRMLHKGVPLGSIVFGVENNSLPEPTSPGSRFVNPWEPFEVDTPVWPPGGHIFKEVKRPISFVILCFHRGVQGFVLGGPRPFTHSGELLVVAHLKVKLRGQDGVVNRPGVLEGARKARAL